MSTTQTPLHRFELDGFPERLTITEHTTERTVVEVDLQPGGCTPLHIHDGYAEHFEVHEGHLDIDLDGTTLTLTAGQGCTAPSGSVHRFANASGEATRFTVILEPGQPGFIDMQRVFFGLRADGRTDADGNPKDPRHAAVALGWSHTAPPTRGAATMMRCFRLLARITGEDTRLRTAYIARQPPTDATAP